MKNQTNANEKPWSALSHSLSKVNHINLFVTNATQHSLRKERPELSTPHQFPTNGSLLPNQQTVLELGIYPFNSGWPKSSFQKH